MPKGDGQAVRRTVERCAAIVARHAQRYHDQHKDQEPTMTLLHIEQEIRALIDPLTNSAGMPYHTEEELRQTA